MLHPFTDLNDPPETELLGSDALLAGRVMNWYVNKILLVYTRGKQSSLA